MAEAVPTLKTLDDFIETLSAQRGLHRKVRLLGHYWRQVRDLPAEDRERIALALGSASAWKHLEKLFGADGYLSEGELAVKRALRRVGTADPAELRILATRLRSGDYTEVGSDLLDAMGRALDDEVGAPPQVDFEPEPEAVSAPAPEPDPEPAAAPETEPAPVAESAPAAMSEPATLSESAPEEEPATQVAAMPPLPPSRVEARFEREPERAPSPDRRPENQARAERRRMMLAATAGWRRRRFLGEWIREGELESLDEALSLAALLESDAQHTWCLGDLVQHWPLEDDQLERVLAAAPSTSARTRLLTRYERAADSL